MHSSTSEAEVANNRRLHYIVLLKLITDRHEASCSPSVISGLLDTEREPWNLLSDANNDLHRSQWELQPGSPRWKCIVL